VARITDSSVERVRAEADFVAVVEERTPLRRQGGRLSGRCPFHEERTPSFTVNPVKKLYHCFGCHKGGDMFQFVKETQGLDFVGAVEWLAERSRIPLEYEESSPAEEARRERRKRLHALLRRELLRAHVVGVSGRRSGTGVPGRARAWRGELPRVPARARTRRQHADAQGT
jgi:DNA primase